jgi:hypothetical protein
MGTTLWAIGLAVLAFVGFFPSYFGKFPGFAGTSAAIHFHVATLALWFGLAIVQTVLVRRGRTDLHRRVGKLAYALVPIMVVGFAAALADGQHRNKNPVLILATLFDAGFFLGLVALGLWQRRRPEHHRRYMILALVPFLNPPLGRLISPAVSIPIELAILVTLLVRARRRHTLARPYAIGLALFLGELAALVAVMVGWPELPEHLWQAMFAAA